MKKADHPKRVLFWSATLFPSVGGIEVLARRFLPAMQERGYEILVVAPSDETEQEEVWEGIRIRRLPFFPVLARKEPAAVLGMKRSVAAIQAAFEPDLTHVNGLHPGIWFQLETRRREKPQLLTLHSWTDLPAGPTTAFGRLIRESDWVTACSEDAMARARATAPEIAARSSVIYNGVLPFEEPPIAPPALPNVLLLFGRLEREKGFDLAIDAFARLAPEFGSRRLRLRVAGDGPERSDLERLSARLGIADRVEFLGWIPHERVGELMRDASLVVVPSRFEEGTNLVALEAAASARPVVAARAGGLPEVVAHGESGLVVDQEDPGALASAVATILADPAAAARMGRSGRERVQRLFGWTRYVEGYDSIYQSLTRETSNAR